jgi:hypothetical protein
MCSQGFNSKISIENNMHMKCFSQDYITKSSNQMDEMVEMVRGHLTSAARITICGLLTISVHGIYFISVRDVILK